MYELKLNAVFDQLTMHGFVRIRRDNQKKASQLLFRIIRKFNPVAVHVSKLKPVSILGARPNSLSSRYGVDAFPPHTDFVTQSIPPKYIALFCPIQRNAATDIYDAQVLSEELMPAACEGIFRLKRIRGSFSCRFRTQRNRKVLFRYNRDCMFPLDDNARAVEKAVLENWKPTVSINWSETSLIIFDNWRYLHGRRTCNQNKLGWLWRVASWENL